MFGRLHGGKPRVFLGSLAVVPRADFKRHVDEWGWGPREDLDAGLRRSLEEIFSLPDARSVNAPRRGDLGLDVVIAKFQLGDVCDLSLGAYGLPLFWRPKVTVRSRLYHLTSGKTRATFSVTERMGWGTYLRRMLTWRAFVHLRPPFDGTDLERLLYLACRRLLEKMQRSV